MSAPKRPAALSLIRAECACRLLQACPVCLGEVPEPVPRERYAPENEPDEH